MNILFLDDDIIRSTAFLKAYPHAVCVETAVDCIIQLKARPWDFVCLDHDLGGEVYVDSSREDCGMEVVRWVQVNKPDVETFVVHTFNSGAAQVMVEDLKSAGYKVIRVPFGKNLLGH